MLDILILAILGAPKMAGRPSWILDLEVGLGHLGLAVGLGVGLKFGPGVALGHVEVGLGQLGIGVGLGHLGVGVGPGHLGVGVGLGHLHLRLLGLASILVSVFSIFSS